MAGQPTDRARRVKRTPGQGVGTRVGTAARYVEGTCDVRPNQYAAEFGNPRRPRARPTERQSHFFNPGVATCPSSSSHLSSRGLSEHARHSHRRPKARERRLHGVARSVKVANRHITGHLANRGSGRPPKRRCVTRETLERDRWTVDSGRRRNDAGGVRRITQQPPRWLVFFSGLGAGWG